jgi:hypothetical protein
MVRVGELLSGTGEERLDPGIGIGRKLVFTFSFCLGVWDVAFVDVSCQFLFCGFLLVGRVGDVGAEPDEEAGWVIEFRGFDATDVTPIWDDGRWYCFWILRGVVSALKKETDIPRLVCKDRELRSSGLELSACHGLVSGSAPKLLLTRI